ncbi:hypothetical protein R3W88_024692 [Solanum pinnatisectum]|uniref:Retrotransposon Copia-like N-terminal domain-containing protein n=1 Tax=Solanum pinnatisectum TaxID=50273 RepID=A0AAV9M4B0_9SOLN|nr:hypothetical protein R3W88_024692 [Solanum pinnatisectum]
MIENNNQAANSPYTLQPTDNPRVSLVTYLLTNTLLVKSKLGFVDGSLPRPTTSSTNKAT